MNLVFDASPSIITHCHVGLARNPVRAGPLVDAERTSRAKF